MAKDASALHCPNCGAPATAGDANCKYCHAQLATVSCPACFAPLFDGMAYCPSCGARRSRSEGGTRTAPCPACKGGKGVMREVLLGDTDLLECDVCHAVWADAATFEHLCANREAQAAVLHQWPGPPTARAADVHYRRCVACGQMMNRMNFGRSSGAVVDVCKGHGTLLDAGELHQIATFIQGGGLERARERQIEDLKEAEARLRAAEQARGMRDMAGVGDSGVSISFSSTTWKGADLLDLLKRLSKET